MERSLDVTSKRRGVLELARGPVRSLAPLGPRTSHLIRPGVPGRAAQGVTQDHVLVGSISLLHGPEPEGARGAAIARRGEHLRVGERCHPRRPVRSSRGTELGRQFLGQNGRQRKGAGLQGKLEQAGP